MNIEAPILKINQEASPSLIDETIRALKGKEVDPFAILSEDAMTYVQTVWTEHGFVLEYQEGSVEEHYEITEFLSVPKVQAIFRYVLNGDNSWKHDYPIQKKHMRTLTYRLGRLLGSFFGHLKRGFNEGRNR
jgi:hypothetical protein